MSIRSHDETDRGLADFLLAGPTMGPDELLADILATTRHVSQRSRWTSPMALVDSVLAERPSAAPVGAWVLLLSAGLLVVVSAALVLVGSRLFAWAPLPPGRAGLIAFDAKGAIIVTNADGSGERRLTDGPGTDLWPAWSPDGSKIAFWRMTGANGPYSLLVLDVASSQTVDVTGTDFVRPSTPSAPSWAPDGQRLVFGASDTSGYAVFIAHADASGIISIGDRSLRASDPVWSPDGTRIAVRGHPAGESSAGLYVIDARTGSTVRMTRSVGTDPGDFADARWSPDATRIAFSAGDGQLSDIYVASADGSGDRRLTVDAADEEGPSWSPDGRQIAFQRDIGGSLYAGLYELAVMNADGTGQRIVPTPLLELSSRSRGTSGSSSSLAWSPDGTKIVAHVKVPDGLVVVEVAGGGAPITIPAPGTVGDISWQRQ